MRLRILSKLPLLLLLAGPVAPAQITINHPQTEVIEFGNSKLRMSLNFDHQCVVTDLTVNGEPVIIGTQGIFTEIRTKSGTRSTCSLANSPSVQYSKNRITLSNICYGGTEFPICENWIFDLTDTDIRLSIYRSVSKPFEAEEISSPAVHFNSIKTWDGAFTDYGGLAWFYLFNEPLCTYGVHSRSAAFWNGKTGNGLRISSDSPSQQTASKFMRSATDELVYSIAISDSTMKYRYDPDTKRRRFIRQKTDVWDRVHVPAGKQEENITFSWLNYQEEYNRGNLAGMNGQQVTGLLNTIARIGVIDAEHFGGNSWHTPYGPICLHEQYIARMGLAINDPDYLNGYKACLNFYRDKAIRPDGRVISRWAYDDSDAMPGTATPDGFYEAQWGYLFDSNPDFVINVADLYNQCGDLDWVRGLKSSCEKALEYLVKRDTNGNHLVEMMTSDHRDQKGSDWIDIIWASFENAFVNAEIYHALVEWASIEKQLGDPERAGRYSNFAAGLKSSFNKSTREGGFWDEQNQWYVHWRDKDQSVHGNNLVVPVNFMAITYGICGDTDRQKAILDRIEEQMEKEKLFAWPLCMYTYEKGEGNDWQFPFPNYENGDIFLSWGETGVQAYAGYKPELALKYIENILNRYEQDGLAFQRYGRALQDGMGDDILAGNSLAVVGLYTSIYGINPLYNRLYLNPHLTDKLYGTEINYRFRGERLNIKLDKNLYTISNKHFHLASTGDFGFYSEAGTLRYFHGASENCALSAQPSDQQELSLQINDCTGDAFNWTQSVSGTKGHIRYTVFSLTPDSEYALNLDQRVKKILHSSSEGILDFEVATSSKPVGILLIKR